MLLCCGHMADTTKKNPAAVALGRRRAQSMTPEERSELARSGAIALAKSMTKAERIARAKHAVACREEKRAAVSKRRTKAK